MGNTQQKATTYDFSGYVSKYGVTCTDGTVIDHNSFSFKDGDSLPLVYDHQRHDLQNVIGRITLEHRDDGIYGYSYLNGSSNAALAKECVQHGDLASYSIAANKIRLSPNGLVEHGRLLEVSLVTAGADEEATIDYVNIDHADDGNGVSLVYIPMEPLVEHADDQDDAKPAVEDEKADTKKNDTFDVDTVLDSMTDEQLALLVAAVHANDNQNDESETKTEPDDKASDKDEEIKHSIEDNTQKDEVMHKNLFESNQDTTKSDDIAKVREMYHTAYEEALKNKDSLSQHLDTSVLEHADREFGVSNIELLFPDAKSIDSEPVGIRTPKPWAQHFLNATSHQPFARVRTWDADLTGDEMRARGYITGNEKLDNVFKVMRRSTEPTTVYAKTKFNRDDIIDANWFDVTAYAYRELKTSLVEEIATAALFGDGRPEILRGSANPDKINEENIRPVYLDDPFYTVRTMVGNHASPDEVFDTIIRNMKYYRGNGAPTLYVAHSLLMDWTLTRIGTDRREYLWDNVAQMASKLGVASIQDVNEMDTMVRTLDDGKTVQPLALLVDESSYRMGTDRGGEITQFNQFDMDFNREKWLIETRLSGALARYHSAMVVERDNADKNDYPVNNKVEHGDRVKMDARSSKAGSSGTGSSQGDTSSH